MRLSSLLYVHYLRKAQAFYSFHCDYYHRQINHIKVDQTWPVVATPRGFIAYFKKVALHCLPLSAKAFCRMRLDLSITGTELHNYTIVNIKFKGYTTIVSLHSLFLEV